MEHCVLPESVMLLVNCEHIYDGYIFNVEAIIRCMLTYVGNY